MKWSVKEEYVDTKKYWMLMIVLVLIVSLFNANRLESRVKKEEII